ncbi:MAG: aldehyde ferredoxin oxidoreductase family protein [Proteobacteria bacterium]|nr:aldehyde ferredoxin oxidoreductase family protein [Pseudomonadota bacterium]
MDAKNAGWMLDVDLSTRTISKEIIDQGLIDQFIGGAGLNAKLLFDRIRPGLDPFSPENPIIFGAGPLVGLSFPTAARSSFTSISPLTGTFGDSNGGGKFGVAVKRAGFDHFVIRGVSKTPCYLVIHGNGTPTLESADGIWGKATDEAQQILKQKHPGSEVVTIGPAGENRVRFASIVSFDDNAQYSRSGMGAVMGSKKLKAIVVTGGRKIPAENQEKLKTLSKQITKHIKELPFPKVFHHYGTIMFLNMLESKGLVYTNNWRKKADLEDIKSIDAAAYFEMADSKKHGCFRCPLTCGKRWSIKTGNLKGEQGNGLEVAHLISLGLTLGVRNIAEILFLIKRCNQMGLDLNEFSGVLGMAVDARIRNLITAEDCDGLLLDWGNAKAFDQMVDLVAHRNGLGNILAEGTKLAAEIIGGGAENYALHMKGMHWPAHSAPPFVLAFSTSTRGGDFLKGVPHLLLQPVNAHISKKLFGATAKTMNIYSHEDKGRSVWWHENYKMVTDSLGICFYLTQTLITHGILSPDHLARILNTACGYRFDGEKIMIAGERGYQVERAINNLRGFSRKEDSFTKRPEPDSWGQGIDLNKKGMLDEYYSYRGLSPEGFLTKERLNELGLEDVLEKLEKHRVLGSQTENNAYLSLKEIVTNPGNKDLAGGLKQKIQNRVRGRMMRRMMESPSQLRHQFNKMRT